MINFTYNKTRYQELLEIHKQCDQDFNPPLSSRVDINSYCKKIFQHAQIIGAYDQNHLIGIICMYTNDKKEMLAYITSICVDINYRGQKIGYQLMKCAIILAKESNMNKLSLEVGKNNQVAISFYKNLGFTIINEKEITMIMNLNLEL